MTSVALSIRDWLTRHHRDQVELLRALVRHPSDNPPGDCAPHAEHTAALLTRCGFEVESYPVPEADVRARGMRSITNLVIRRGAESGPVVALNAHGDVVPPGQGWSRDPYGGEVVGEQLYGRGAAVSKSDFATYAYAALAAEAAGTLGGRIELHLTYDEEVGGELGPRWLLAQGITHPDLAICAGFSYGVVTAHNGCLHLEVEVNGRIAHAAQPDTGRDALEAATAILHRLYGERAGYGAVRSVIPGIQSPTLVVGTIEGGVNTNVVPDRVRFRLDRRLIPEEDPDAVETRLEAVIKETVQSFPERTCTVRRILRAEPLVPLPGADHMARIIAGHAHAVFGEPVAAHGVPLYTDARHYAAAGIPTVLYGAGPRTLTEAGAHGADERVVLGDLRGATEVIARSLVELLPP